MLRRNLRRTLRYPVVPPPSRSASRSSSCCCSSSSSATRSAPGLGAAAAAAPTLDYVTPGILLLAVVGAAQGVAIAVAMDMTEGIIARFRTMAIARVSVLTGHVVGALIQTLIALVVVLAVALARRLPPDRVGAGLARRCSRCWSLVTLASIWLSVALGLVAKSVETASNLPMPLILLPFLGSGFVPTDSMPPAMRWFAEYQPFTPIMETLRGLLMGTPIGSSGVHAVAWSVGGGLLAYVWAKRLYNRDPTP